MDDTSPSPILRLVDLHLSYSQGDRELHVLRGATAEAKRGESIALLGQSGAGKSSLLHIIGLLDHPQKGAVIIDDMDCAGLSDAERTRLRRIKLGFVYQFHHLLPEFSALENVVLPQLILGTKRREAEANGRRILETLGLTDRIAHRPAQMSGGEQQRVALARAVVNNPGLLLADEPTGNLDPDTAERVFGQLTELVREAGLTAIIATHNMELARRMDRIWRIENGLISEISPAKV